MLYHHKLNVGMFSRIDPHSFKPEVINSLIIVTTDLLKIVIFVLIGGEL